MKKNTRIGKEEIMSKKLIAIDLDGTTLNNDSIITNKTIQVLNQVQNLGHPVVIVTGRPYRNTKVIYHSLGIQNPLVNFNGALCHNPFNVTNNIGYHLAMNSEIVSDLVEFFPHLQAKMLMAEGKEYLYSTSLDIPVNTYFDKDVKPLILSQTTVRKEDTTALTIFSPISDQQRIKKQLLSRYGNEIDVRTWGGSMPCLEVVSKGVHKGLGVEYLSQLYAIRPKDILAFGDEENDREMLEFAGHGVAMKNAIPDLIQIAQDVTLFTNHEDGLARYLADYFRI